MLLVFSYICERDTFVVTLFISAVIQEDISDLGNMLRSARCFQMFNEGERKCLGQFKGLNIPREYEQGSV